MATDQTKKLFSQIKPKSSFRRRAIHTVIKIPLEIFLVALEIQTYKNNYQKLKSNIQKINKIIIVSRYIYKIYQKKFV